MNRFLLIFALILLLIGSLGYWQKDRIGGLIAGLGFGKSIFTSFGAGGGGGGGDAKQPGAPPSEIEGVRVVGIINSARPSAVIDAYGKLYTVLVGDELQLQLTKGAEPQRVRCEAIAGLVVTLYFPSNDTRVQIPLSK